MKSFSPSAFAGNRHDAALARAGAAIARDPQALFTDFQWFLFAGHDTIFFTAFSRHSFDKARLAELVRQMVALAPQLTHGFAGARPGEPFTEAQLDAVTSAVDVDSLEPYPDRWLSESADIFERRDLPLLRVMAANRRGGPDAEGRASVVQVRAAHALLEGSDSALLMRSQLAAHGVMSDRRRKVALARRLRGLLGGLLIAVPHLVFAHLLAPPPVETHFRTLALRRDRMRRLATRLGVRQRSLYFALVTHALFSDPARRRDPEAVRAYYTTLDSERHAADDDFFRVRTLAARLPMQDDFAAFARGVDTIIDEVEGKDTTRAQMAVNAMFSTHRRLHRLFPFLYGPRFWRFRGRTDIVLTMVPPHYAMGPLTPWIQEPIHVGAFHPSSNICTFCPGREFMTISFAMGKAGTEAVGEIEALLARTEAALEEAPPAMAAP